MIDEIVILAENESMLYVRLVEPICKNLAKKKVKGVFDPRKAIKAFVPVVEEMMRIYLRRFPDEYSRWYQILKVKERELAAAKLLIFFEDLIDEYAEDLKK